MSSRAIRVLAMERELLQNESFLTKKMYLDVLPTYIHVIGLIPTLWYPRQWSRTLESTLRANLWTG